MLVGIKGMYFPVFTRESYLILNRHSEKILPYSVGQLLLIAKSPTTVTFLGTIARIFRRCMYELNMESIL